MKQLLVTLITISVDMTKSWRQLFVIHTLTLREVLLEQGDVKTFIFTSNKPLRYSPGQYGIWLQKRWVKSFPPDHLFTVASVPEEGVVRLTTHITSSDYKQKLNQLAVGKSLWMIGPVGQFTLAKSPQKEVVLLAGGIGITPMRAIVKHVYDQKLPTHTTLIHSSSDFYLFQDEMKTYVDDAHFVARDSLTQTITEVSKARPQATYYVSGPPAFVGSTVKTLKQNNIKAIKTDGFLGY